MKRRMFGLLAALLVLALVVPALGCGNDGTAAVPALSLWTGDETVRTLSGEVLGFEDRADTWVWRAIPYARPPVGPLRWKAPVDPDPWGDVREETEYCSECPQYDIDNSVLGDENCLSTACWAMKTAST